MTIMMARVMQSERERERESGRAACGRVVGGASSRCCRPQGTWIKSMRQRLRWWRRC